MKKWLGIGSVIAIGAALFAAQPAVARGPLAGEGTEIRGHDT